MAATFSYFFHSTFNNQKNTPLIGRVSDASAALLADHIIPTFQSLDGDTYANGPLYMLGTLARSSYVLTGNCVIWCVEWQPGLIAVEFCASGEMRWTAIRDPRPDFGGREPIPDHLDDAVDEYDNPLYPLVFDAWDAAIEGDIDGIDARLATDEEQRKFSTAMAVADAFFERPPRELDSDAGKAWIQKCKDTIANFAGDGVRFWER